MEVLMCPPPYFSVNEKDRQNKHMDPENKPNVETAVSSHENLIRLYEYLRIKVHLIDPEPGLVDMTFAANCGLLSGKKVLMSNFRPERRRAEAECYAEWFRNHEYEVRWLPKGIFFEGAGDAVPYNGKIICGYGFRTSKKALAHIEKFSGKEVIPVKLVSPGRKKRNLYHFDTTSIVLENSDTFISYRGAFDKESLARLEKIAAVLPASFEDADKLALNAVVLPRSEFDQDHPLYLERYGGKPFGGAVVTSRFASKELLKTLESLGYYTTTLALDEFLKAGGGAFCLTKIL